MAKEKFIRGKKDDCNHDGLYANRKRELWAQAEQVLGEQLIASLAVYRQRDKFPPDLVDWHEKLLRFWGLID